MFINSKELKKIIKLMEEKDLIEFSYEEEGKKIYLKRGKESLVYSPLPSFEKEKEQKTEEKKNIIQNTISITSPMVGTFYRAPSPDAEPFVEIGKIVEKGDVLCIIEAMKLMNELKSEHRGKIVKILVENGLAVEYGQELFILEPIEKK